MRHFWTTDHDIVLGEAVRDMLPLRDALLGPREVWWGAVAAETMRRLGVTDIGPNAARSRWELLARQGREASDAAERARAALAEIDDADAAGILPETDPMDGWERTVRAVEEWERTLGEETRDSVSRIERKLFEMEDRIVADIVTVVEMIREDVAALRREWEGTR